MGLEAGRLADRLVFNLIKKGHEASSLCYDGFPFFHNNHPVYSNVDGTGTATGIKNNYVAGGSGVNSTPWYLLDTSRALKPIIFQQRQAPEFTHMTDRADESVFMRNEYRYGIYSRCNVGFGFWQMAARSTKELNRKHFEEVYDGMRALKADGGNPLDVRPNILLVPTTLYNKAVEIVGVARDASGADNPNHNRVKIIESAWLN